MWLLGKIWCAILKTERKCHGRLKKNLIQTVRNESDFELSNFWLIIPALYTRFLWSSAVQRMKPACLVQVWPLITSGARGWGQALEHIDAVVCPWRWIIKLSRGEICSITCWALVKSHQHNMDYISSAVCSMIMNWFIMHLCHFLVSIYHSRYKDGLIRLLDHFFCNYFIGFWVMPCLGDDLHFPCITAKEDNILGQLNYL